MSLITIAAYALGVITAIDAIMRARTSQGSIAWAVVLIGFPYVAVPAYWVLGRSKFNGYVRAFRVRDAAISELSQSASSGTGTFALVGDARPEVGRAAEKLARYPFTGGNRAELLIDGVQTFASILEGMRSAEDYILFQFYIVRDDEIGREVQEVLCEKATEGVRVYFLFDEVGSHQLPRSYLHRLEAAGVHVFNFHTAKGPKNRFQLNFRNHRKLVVVDGTDAWLGGHNVGDEYLGRDPSFGDWRDTHIRISGPAVLGAQLSFSEDWHWATGEVPWVDWNPDHETEGQCAVLMAPSGPADDLETASLMFTHAINSTTERVWIASPYFIPDGSTMAALKLAALRDVDVRVLIPDRADHWQVYLAGFAYVEEAVAAGVKVYRYEAGFLHQKVMLLDSAAAAVGSANFDNRSFRLNFELSAIVNDRAFAAEVERMLEGDLRRSRLVAADELASRGPLFRFGVRTARLAGPIL